ncbi:hypothetical protein EBR21_09245 [bacterium]|nr:hypothetical protein [bacterium]
MKEQQDRAPTWKSFGRSFALRLAVHILTTLVLWTALLFYEELKKALPVGEGAGFWSHLAHHIERFSTDARPAVVPGLLTLSCVGLAWTSLTLAIPLWLAVCFCAAMIAVGGLFARFPIPEQASHWLVFWGPETPRFFQLSLIFLAVGLSIAFLLTKLARQYEQLNRDRLVLSPAEEDLAIRAIVQSTLKFALIVVAAVVLWNVANTRPIPAVAQADARETKPSVLLLAVDSGMHFEHLRKQLGEPFFESWVVFGSPNLSAKFDEVLQCRYPIRLVGQTGPKKANSGPRDVTDFFIPAALENIGYLASLLHTSSPGEGSEALKMLSRNFSHLRLFRRFGLLLPSRVFYTPDVQLSQMREALSQAVGRGKSAFLTATLLSRNGRQQTSDDSGQFETFLRALSEHGWFRNLIIVLFEFPNTSVNGKSDQLSIGATSAKVSFWASGSLADSSLIPSPPKLVRGIDVGASLAARLRLASVVAQCDGFALFDISERPSIFPRELVYQEVDADDGQDVFRKRGWLTSDGYRLEIKENQNGGIATTFRFSLKQNGAERSWRPVDEKLVLEPAIGAELNRQLDDFLRSTGVEILNLGNGRMAYSEPFRRVRLLER